jgi:MYXO-CTERM domain-containing protein
MQQLRIASFVGFTLLALPASLEAQECPAEAVGCHRGNVDFAYREMRLPSISLDTGWVPSGSPIQVRFTLDLMGETHIDMGGQLTTYWPFGLTMGVPGRTDAGRLHMAWGVQVTAQARINVSIAGVRYTWEGSIPFVPEFDFRMNDDETFTPFVLPGSVPRPVVVEDTTDPLRLFGVGIRDIVGSSIAGIDGGLEVQARGRLMTSYQGTRTFIDEAREPIVTALQAVQYWAPSAAEFGAAQDITVRPEGTLTYNGQVVLTPAFYVTLLGRRWEIPIVDVPIQIVDSSRSIMFEADMVHVPLPDIAVDPTMIDIGTVELGALTSRSIRIANRGEAELSVRVDPSLSIAPSMTPFTLLPSSEGMLVLDVMPMGSGPYSETVTLRTNDPDQPTIRIRVTGDVTARDAGTDAALYVDAGPRDAGAGDASMRSDAGDLGGLAGGACGCAVPGSTHTHRQAWWLAPLALLGSLTLRRRTKRSAGA